MDLPHLHGTEKFFGFLGISTSTDLPQEPHFTVTFMSP